jgi:hypothetical protein
MYFIALIITVNPSDFIISSGFLLPDKTAMYRR